MLDSKTIIKYRSQTMVQDYLLPDTYILIFTTRVSLVVIRILFNSRCNEHYIRWYIISTITFATSWRAIS